MRLRRIPNTDVEQGAFMASGSLAGLRPPRTPVRSLDLRRVSGRDALAPLAQLDELADLTLEYCIDVDLAPLASLPLDTLEMRWIRDTDLGPLADLRRLTRLSVVHPRDCTVPPQLRLANSLIVIGA